MWSDEGEVKPQLVRSWERTRGVGLQVGGPVDGDLRGSAEFVLNGV